MILFSKKSTSENDKIVVFSATENGAEKGECILDLRMRFAEVTYVTYDADMPHITEGLIRTAFNYAANKGFYIGKCKCKNAYTVLERMNFEFKDDEYTNDIPSILIGKCCCENK